MKKTNLVCFALSFSLIATTAEAAVVVTAVAGFLTSVGFSAAAASFIIRIGTSFIMSALQYALSSKPKQAQAAGITTESTTSGGSNYQTFILGKYATAGNAAAPPYSEPNDGSVPNRFLTYVIDLSDVPGVTFGRLAINGAYVDDLTPVVGGLHDFQGMMDGGVPRLKMNYYDGSQTAADRYMLGTFGDHDERPWGADMVGTGVAYAVLTFDYDREFFNGLPSVRFEAQGVPLYDPRSDSSVSGSGAQRWGDPTTWAQTGNPAVMIYNILRGVTLPDGRIWGGRAAVDDLPLENWFAAMNECDVSVPLSDATVAFGGGDFEPQYVAGFEVSLDMEPADVIAELEKSCSGSVVEMGGVYKMRVGPPALPVFFFTDDDVVIDETEKLIPHPGLDGVHNAIHVTHPDPEALWEPVEAAPQYNPDWEIEDRDRQLVADVDLPAVASDTQAQRLGLAWIRDARRFRRHSLALPPEAAVLEPLDTCGWTSARHGYNGKVFEINELADDLVTVVQSISIRERDGNDFAWDPAIDETSRVPGNVVVPVLLPRLVSGFDVEPAELVDADGVSRRPAVLLTWATGDLSDATGLDYQVRAFGQLDLVASGSVADLAAGDQKVSSGIFKGVTYQVRARLISPRLVEWTDWALVVAPDVGLTAADIAADGLDLSVMAADVRAQLAVAGEVRQDHDTLVEGFVGGLSDAFADQAVSIDTVRAEAEANIVPLGSSVFRTPRATFTDKSTFLLADIVKPEIASGTFVTDDVDFGECFEFGSTANLIVGQASPFSFEPGRIYKLSVLYRVTDDNGGGGVRLAIGMTTQHGVTRLQQNQQRTVAEAAVVADGVVSSSIYFSTDAAALVAYGLSSSDYISLTGSDLATAAYPHVRQNFGSNTAGVLRIRSLEVQDVTDAVLGLNELRVVLGDAVAGLSATLVSDYYTSAQSDAAIAAASLALSSSIGNVSADLSNNYSTTATVNAAIAAVQTSLTADLGDIEADIDQVFALTVDDGSALGVLLEQLSVDAGGISAVITNHASAVADLSGFASAYAGVTVQTVGGQVSGFLATSFSNPDGTGGATLELLGDVIAEGSVSTNRLSVGLGRNLLSNTDFVDGLNGWVVHSKIGLSADETALGIRNPGEAWAGGAYPTLEIRQTGSEAAGFFQVEHKPSYADGGNAEGVPVVVGDWVEISFRASIHRCVLNYHIVFRDENGADLSIGPAETVSTSVTSSSTNPNAWPVYGSLAEVPAGAAYATIMWEKGGTTSNASSIVFIHQPQLAASHENSTMPAPYSPGGTTLIAGGRIATDAIDARHISAGSITTASLDVNDLTISGDLIDNDATSRRFFSGNVTQTVLESSYLPISGDMECDFAAYVDVDPSQPFLGVRNPVSAMVNGLFKPLTAADGRLYFKVEARTVGAASWSNIDVMGIRYFYASDVNRWLEFTVLWADDGIGQPASSYDEYRVICKQLDAGAGDVEFSFVNTRMEQINGYT